MDWVHDQPSRKLVQLQDFKYVKKYAEEEEGEHISIIFIVLLVLKQYPYPMLFVSTFLQLITSLLRILDCLLFSCSVDRFNSFYLQNVMQPVFRQIRNKRSTNHHSS